MFDAGQVGVLENEVFHILVLSRKQRGQVQLFLLPEIVEHRFAGGGGRVKGPFQWLGGAVVILHVVGEGHHLRQVDEAAEFRIFEPGVDPVSFREDSVPVVGLFDLDEDQRHSIDQQRDVRTEDIIPVLAGQLGDDVQRVIREVFEIEELQAGDSREPLVKRFTQILIVQEQHGLLKGPVDFIRSGGRVYPLKGRPEQGKK